MHEFEKAISLLKELSVNGFITIQNVEFWILNHTDLWRKSIRTYSCSVNSVRLPCFCSIRKTDCLFIDLFKKLHEIKDHQEFIEFITPKVIHYEAIKGIVEAETLWLQGVLDIDIFDVCPITDTKTNFYVRLKNGNGIENNQEYFTIEVPNEEFKYSRDFFIIYAELFFEKKLLPLAYDKWAEVSGYNDFKELES